MPVEKLKPNDPRVQYPVANVRGKTYQYILGKPKGTPRATILLIHGWPDLGFGWRYQVPFLMSMGLQVIAPDMLGYGGTDAPQDLALYSLKSVSDDLAELLRQVVVPGEQVILGGHDWGGALVWRFVLWHPELVRGVFSVCTPYTPPLPVFVDLPELTERLPNFRYQLHLAGPDVEREIGSDPAKIRALLSSLYGARGPGGEAAFSTHDGVLFENLSKVGRCPLLGDDEVDFYVRQYARNGMRGPLNWYRTRRHNYEEELALLRDGKPPRVARPSLVILAEKDHALPPKMAQGMEAHFDDLRKETVGGTHWALWDSTEHVNDEIGRFVEQVLSGPGKASL